MNIGLFATTVRIALVLSALSAAAQREECRPGRELVLAAERGDPAAQEELADFYLRVGEEGRCLSFSSPFSEAEHWYRKGAAQGRPTSQYGLARTLMFKVRTNKFVNTARVWVAVSPRPEPMRTFIVEEAVAWYSVAANQSFAPAQLELGRQHESGRHVLQDDAEAYKWFALAAKSAPTAEEAKKCIEALRATMAPKDIAEGERRASEFFPKSGAQQATPRPWMVKLLKLQGFGGTERDRVAIINGKTFGVGDRAFVTLEAGRVVTVVTCIAIKQSSVRVTVGGALGEHELTMVIPKVAADTINANTGSR